MEHDGIAVFGSADPRPGDPLYEQAVFVGRLLARAGYEVVTGGYGGVMEGASRGALSAGGCTVGVTCEIFGGRSPNAFLSRTCRTSDLFERTRRLIEMARGYVVLRGKAGTLAELAQLWALSRAGCLEGKPVVLLGTAWHTLVDELQRSGMLEPLQIRITRRVDRPEQVVPALVAMLDAASGD